MPLQSYEHTGQHDEIVTKEQALALAQAAANMAGVEVVFLKTSGQEAVHIHPDPLLGVNEEVPSVIPKAKVQIEITSLNDTGTLYAEADRLQQDLAA